MAFVLTIKILNTLLNNLYDNTMDIPTLHATETGMYILSRQNKTRIEWKHEKLYRSVLTSVSTFSIDGFDK